MTKSEKSEKKVTQTTEKSDKKWQTIHQKKWQTGVKYLHNRTKTSEFEESN